MPPQASTPLFGPDTGFPGRISVHMANGRVANETGCFVCSLSEAGCRAAAEGADEGVFTRGRPVSVMLYGRKPMALEGRVSADPEVIEGWGAFVSVAFDALTARQRKAVFDLLGSDDPHVSTRTSRVYRRRRKRKNVRVAALVAAALVLGFVAVGVVQKLPGWLGSGYRKARSGAASAMREELKNMTPEERRALLETVGPGQAGEWREAASSLSGEEKRAIYDSLSDEEKRQARELYERGK